MLTPSDVEIMSEMFGLNQTDRSDVFGSRVVVAAEPCGFITRAPRNGKNEGDSRIVLSDGYHFEYGAWNGVSFAGDFKKCVFRIKGGTFAVVDYDQKPERLFLFPNEPGFDLRRISDLLSSHRRRRLRTLITM